MSKFSLFTSFPFEIQSLILKACPENDRICLSLTCKNLYSLAFREHRVPLLHRGVTTACGAGDGTFKTWQNMYNKGWDWSHRYQCHRLCHAAMAERCAAESRDAPPLGRCRTFWRTQHCECFSVEKPLHRQLKPWMPKGLYFCRVCERFTVRKRWHNGRCYHGLGKTRRRQNGGIRWTHRSRRGGFGYKMWAKGFRNEAMDRMEARLRHPSDRHNNKRYELRQLPPRMIDTKEVRDSHARHWQS